MADDLALAQDLDLRKARYFLVTAETLHFGRAAERLHIAQPVLTRQIRAFEQDLGIVLFERSSHGTRLSEEGAALVEELRALLRAARSVQSHAGRLRGSTGRFVVGFMPGVVATPLIRALQERFIGLEADTVRTSYDDQTEIVREGRADVAFARLPIDRRGLAVTSAFEEPRVAVLSVDHPLASSPGVALDDLAALPLLQDPALVPELVGLPVTATAHPQPTVEEKLERVAIERGFVILPESTARFYTRPDLVLRHVDGLEPSRVVLVAAERPASPVVRAALEIVRGWGPVDGQQDPSQRLEPTLVG